MVFVYYYSVLSFGFVRNGYLKYLVILRTYIFLFGTAGLRISQSPMS